MTLEQKIEALAIIASERYRDLVIPLLHEKLALVEKDICDSDAGDERNRGFRQGLRWVLNREDSLRREIENLRSSAGQEPSG